MKNDVRSIFSVISLVSIEYHYLVLLETMEFPPKSVMDQLARENRGPPMMAASIALTVLAGSCWCGGDFASDCSKNGCSFASA